MKPITCLMLCTAGLLPVGGALLTLGWCVERESLVRIGNEVLLLALLISNAPLIALGVFQGLTLAKRLNL
jgi:hypothetical protein